MSGGHQGEGNTCAGAGTKLMPLSRSLNFPIDKMDHPSVLSPAITHKASVFVCVCQWCYKHITTYNCHMANVTSPVIITIENMFRRCSHLLKGHKGRGMMRSVEPSAGVSCRPPSAASALSALVLSLMASPGNKKWK